MRNRNYRVICGALALVCGGGAATAFGQVRYENKNGIRYQVTQQVSQRQVPVTVMQDRQQTVYTQQLTSNTINQQQLYTVPSTSYQWDSRLNGRWNPFITPYWTYNLRPVTTWSTQLANVQIPVNQVAWVPQNKTVQVPVTTYRAAEDRTETWVAMSGTSIPSTGLASARPISNRPTTIATRPGTTLGGVALKNDPPKQPTGGWQSPSTTTGNRY